VVSKKRILSTNKALTHGWHHVILLGVKNIYRLGNPVHKNRQ
jgi:hypothetical protein